MTSKEAFEFIDRVFGSDIARDVELLSVGYSGRERPAYARVARETAARYRDARKSDVTLPALVVADFRDYINEVYPEAQLS